MIFETKIFSRSFFTFANPHDFVIRVLHITATHCMLYRHALAATSLPENWKMSAQSKVEKAVPGTFF